VAQAGTTHAVVVVALLVLPAGAGADAEVGGKPTPNAGEWGSGSTSSGTSEKH
jgi:hypothetical protein